MKKYIEHINPIEFTPATSSFVFFPGKKQGKRRSTRFANIRSIQFNDFLPWEIAYIDEIVSGSTMLEHLQEIIDTIGRAQWSISCFELADAEGTKFRNDVRQKLQNCVKNKAIELFEFKPVKRPLGEDDSQTQATNWNAVVSPDNQLYVIGDFVLGHAVGLCEMAIELIR